MKEILGGVTAAKGFMAASCEANIKYKDRTDMAMVYSKTPCVCAGTFTTNVVKAACVKWDQKVVHSGEMMQAVVINSGIANAATGQKGWDACVATAKAVENTLNVPYTSVAVASTGVIGAQLPVEKLVKGVEMMSTVLKDSVEAGTEAAKAIMTTDTLHKELAVSFTVGNKEVTLGGMSKGSGMIHPNMCTMLAFLTTDLAIEKSLLQEAVSDVVGDTFNMITVDGDTSTNDTLLLMANGEAKNPVITEKNEDYNTFKEALYFVCETLAKKMAADGEGASKLFEAKVVNAKTKEDAKILSRAIVGSNLSKAAIFGCDANFGRFLCAMGYSGSLFDENDVEMFFQSENGTIQVFDKGTPLEFDEEKALKIMKAKSVCVFVDMHEGDASATAWGCDLTHEYVTINADYRS